MRTRLEQHVQLAGGVADGLRRNPDAIQHREEEVGHRGAVFVLDVPPCLHGAAALARDQDREVVVVVAIRIGDTATVDEHRVVEEGAVRLLNGFHPIQDIGELLDMERIDLLKLVELFRVLAVVADLVVAVGDPDVAVRPVAALVRQHEGADPRQVGLERQRHNVAHQSDVLAHVGRRGELDARW